MKTKHLDVGCGSNPRNPFNYDQLYAIDIVSEINVNSIRNQAAPSDVHALRARRVIIESDKNFFYSQGNAALERMPFEDNLFDSISAYDFIEHIPRLTVEGNKTRFPFIEFMNEAHRVLKPNGTFYAITPCFPYREVFVDPTHVNFITEKTHEYFTTPTLTARMYGFNGQFEIVRVKRVFSRLEKRKKTLGTFLKTLLYSMVTPTKKSHIVWEFRAIKS